MRLVDLHFKAFGPFTDRRLDFGTTVGLHIVFGPNEAGKSTALRGISDLLFGFPHRTPDAHLHREPGLRIGAEIASDAGDRLSFLRRKGRTTTLRDPADEPIAEDSLRPFLGQVEQRFFENVFGLDHERLRVGGQQILDTGGDLGLSLFSAATGLVALGRVLAEMESEASALFVPRGNRPVNEGIRTLEDARKRERELRLPAESWRKLHAAVEEKGRECQAILLRIETLQAECQRLERIRRTRDLLGKRAACLAALARLGDLPDLPADAGPRRREAEKHLQDAERDLARATEAIAERRAEIDAIEVPEPLLASGDEIVALGQEIAGMRKAHDDLPRREGEAREKSARVRELLRQAGYAETAGPLELKVPPLPEMKTLRRLIGEERDIARKEAAANDAERDAATDLERDGKALAHLPASIDVGSLARSIQRAERLGAIDEQLREARGRLDQARSRAAGELSRLPLWGRSLDDLVGAAMPSPETAAAFATRARDAAAARTKATDRVQEAAERIDSCASELRGLAAVGALPSRDDEARLRSRRDAAWRLIRRGFVDGREDVVEVARAIDDRAPLPEVYELLVADADAISDQRQAHAERLARQTSLLAELGAEQRGLATATDEAAVRERVESALVAEWRELWAPSGVEPLSPEEMKAWLTARQEIVRQQEAVEAERRAAAGLEERIAEHRATVGAALEAIGVEPAETSNSLEVTLENARPLVERERAHEAERARLAERIQVSEARAHAARRSRSALEDERSTWSRRWTSALERIGRAPEDRPEVIAEVIDLLGDAATEVASLRELEHRIFRMREDCESYTARTLQVASRLTPDLVGRSPTEIATELGLRLDRGRQLREQREHAARAIDGQQSSALDATRRLDDATQVLEELRRQAGGSAGEDLEALERQVAERDGHVARRDDVEKQLLDGGAGLSIEELEVEAAAVDRDRLVPRLEACGEEIDELQRERVRISEEIGSMRAQLAGMDGGDSAAASAQAAEEALAVIRGHTERYVRLRLAAVVLRRAIDRYRDQNQAPLLCRAEKLFADLTLGRHGNLRVEYDERDQPVLRAVSSDGTTRAVNEMSDGTRDQLYLALRLAVIDQHLESNESLPLVLDDLLVHFDDERARRTLQILAAFGARTQVLLFTHHRHLVALAESALEPDSFALHEL